MSASDNGELVALAERVESSLEKLKVWAKLNGSDNLFAMLNDDKSIEDYLAFVERKATTELKEATTELEMEKKRVEPNEFTVRRYLNKIDEHNEILNRLAEYKQYRNAKLRRAYSQ